MTEIHLTGLLVCRDDDEVAAVREHLARHVALTRDEPGCISFEVTPHDQDPYVWTVDERFRNVEALRAHQQRVLRSEWGRATAGIERRYTTQPARTARTGTGLGRRVAAGAVNAISFGLPDVVPSRRRRWLIRTALHGGALGSSVPAIRRTAPQRQQAWRRLTAASAETRRIASAVAAVVAIVSGLILFGWYRLLVRSANALAARGVRYPRMLVAVVSESLAFAVSTRLEHARTTRRRPARTAPDPLPTRP